ncbi:hypothetical protein F5141DRAFT_1221184 [Pisolithus sp. B1]|nr:hypothetical protein F5141DRAFT_1221184 [Pisolithus sp. B1]
MFPTVLFNNPWSSWHSPNEDTQTIPEYDLFDDDMTSTDMTSTHNLGNCTNDTATPTQSQLDTLPPTAHAQVNAPASVPLSDLGLEHDLDVWQLHALSHPNTSEPECLSTPNVSASKCMELDTPMDLGTSTKGSDVLASKCRYEEVDFSQSLSQGLYEKEEVIQKLQKRIQEQGWQNDVVTGLQSLLKERESELSGLREAFDFNELQNQFESNMQSQIDKLQTTRMAEIETHVQEEVSRLSSMLQADKERELANIKQHYAQLKKPVSYLCVWDGLRLLKVLLITHSS